MKKVVFALLIVMVVTLSMFVLVSCGDSQENDLAQIKVKFVVGDKVISEETFTEGTPIPKPTYTTYGSLKIASWRVDGKSVLFPYKAGKTDLTFVAYTINTIEVKFMVDGSVYQEETYDSNGFVAVPENPKLDGYIFRYWKIGNEHASFPYSLKNLENTSSITFEAVFDRVYTAQFIVDGEVYSTSTYSGGDTIQMPESPVLTQQTFIYWLDDKGNKLEEGTIINSDQTYTALFEDNFYIITYYIGVSSTPYKVIATSGKILNLQYEGGGDFYGWYTSNKFSTKVNFSKPVTSNVSVYGKVYTTDYSMLVESNNEKIALDTTNFKDEYTFDATYAKYINISVASSTVTAKYTFNCSNGKKVSIAYDMFKGTAYCVYGSNDSVVTLTFAKYNYSAIDYTSYSTSTTTPDGYYNSALTKLGLMVAKTSGELVHNRYITTKTSGIVTNGIEDPTFDATLDASV